MQKTLIINGEIITEKGLVRSDVLIDITGTIEDIKPQIKDHKNVTVIDATGKLLFPLLIDCHVHFREPGLTHKGTMLTESASALAGGVGTVCEMPNTIPPTVTVSALADKVRRAEMVDGVMLKFFFGITEAIHLQALRDLWTGSSLELKRLRRHCAGVKLFFDHSTGDQKVDGGIIDDIFKTCAELKIPLVAHCEDATINSQFSITNSQLPQTIDAHSKNRPPESEAKAIAEAIGFAEKHGTHLHIAHLSTKQGIDLVRTAKKNSINVTCEVAPHHLFLTTDDYTSLGTFGKMNPPLRSAEHQKALWEGIADGTVDCIATDHAPHTIDEKKTGEPLKAPSGVPGVETMLPLLLTVASGHSPHPSSNLRPQTSKLSYPDILRLCFTNPNRIFSLGQEPIGVKAKARIAIVDPIKEWVIEAKNLLSHCGWTPYEGWRVQGAITSIIQ